jgi:hypothetical protein
MALKNYAREQARKIKKEVAARPPTTPTDVACTEKHCDGEMMWTEPRQKHPQLKGLARAICGECGWKGWI